MEFLMQPGLYRTGTAESLSDFVMDIWREAFADPKGTIYVASGFANRSGVEQFETLFTDYVKRGGRVCVLVCGSRNERERFFSVQAAEKLLICGAEVYVAHREEILHAKCYGYDGPSGAGLVVASGNLTYAGMCKNGEAALRLGKKDLEGIGFSWPEYWERLTVHWKSVRLGLDDISVKKSVGRLYLYDENDRHGTGIEEGKGNDEDETEEFDDAVEKKTMVLKLGDYDTGFICGKTGPDYFTLSYKSMDFFPELKSEKGKRKTRFCDVSMHYVWLNVDDTSCVSFHSNFDLRLSLKALRKTNTAERDDLALITRLGECSYELRIIKTQDPAYETFLGYAQRKVGNKDKVYGYVSNAEMHEILDRKE